MKRMVVILAVLAAAALVGAGGALWLTATLNSAAGRVLSPPPKVRFSIEQLERQDLLFLVTDRVVTRVVVEQSEHSLLLGGREGYLIATARIYYGVDLQSVGPEDVEQRDNETVVRIPRPQLLEFAVDPDMAIVSKRTGLQAMRDWLAGRDMEEELRARIQAEAIAFADNNDLLPEPDAILRKLNRFAPTLVPAGAVPVRFAFEKDSDEAKAKSAAVSAD